MFKMSGYIKFEGYKPLQPSAIKWNRSIDNISDSATITIPGICRMVNKDVRYSNVQTALQFKNGQKVEIFAGYDGFNVKRFQGFIRRVNFKIPVEIECEGYAYRLRQKTNINLSFANIKMKAALQHIIEGTDIVLADNIPDITIPKLFFKNMTGLECIEWFKEKMLMTVYFNFNQLYVGLRYLDVSKEKIEHPDVKHRLNWNVIKDTELLFGEKELAKVNIKLAAPTKGGSKQKEATNLKGASEVRKEYPFALSATRMQEIAEDQRRKLSKTGYTGKITAFLTPAVEPAMSTQIIDTAYKERNGKYFIEAVEGSFDKSGGRQQITIGLSLEPYLKENDGTN